GHEPHERLEGYRARCAPATGAARSRVAQLGRDLSEPGEPFAVAKARFRKRSQRLRQRREREILLEQPTPRARDADAGEAMRELVDDPRLADPGLPLDEEKRRLARVE